MSDVLAGTGVVVAAGAASAAILLPAGRPRAAAMLAALALFPLLILGDQWHSPQIADLRDDTMRLAGLAAAISAILATTFHRWPVLLPLAIVAALPFRIPLESGGDTANLLVPLYLVIAGGVLATAVRDWRPRPSGPVATGHPGSSAPPAGGVGVGWTRRARRLWSARPRPWRRVRPCSGAARRAAEASPTPTTGPAGRAAWLPWTLAAVVVLYAIQALYSPDFSKSLQSVCFFFVPFSLVYALLRDVEWDRRLLRLVLWVVAIEAVAFVAVGSVEYASESLLWNDLVARSNEFHTYFRVNSVFWDPNIYGRYLALAAVLAMGALLWTRDRRSFALLTALIAVLWIGLFPTFSQSSFAALLAGLAVLAALKWSLRWTLGAVGVAAVIGVLVVALAGGSEKLSFSRINIDTSGRANLVSGGIHLFAQRPVYGYGSGSFPKAYREHVRTRKVPVSVSHTQPITVAAEQGLVGLASYTALIVIALWTMASGLWPRQPVGSDQDAPPAGGVGVGWTRRARRLWSARSHPSQRVRPGSGAARRAAEASPNPATGPATTTVGLVAVLAAFVALLVHTMAYAGFYEDPIAWALLAVGASLASAPVRDAS